MSIQKKQATQFSTAALILSIIGWSLFLLAYLINSTSTGLTTNPVVSIFSFVAFVLELLALIFGCLGNKNTAKKVYSVLAIVFSAIYMGFMLIGLVFLASIMGRYM